MVNTLFLRKKAIFAMIYRSLTEARPKRHSSCPIRKNFVARSSLDGSRKKGGITVHALMDVFSGVTVFLWIPEAKEHDRKFRYHGKPPVYRVIVFGKAYNRCSQFVQ